MAATVTILPVKNDVPWYKFKFVLSKTLYTLRFRYNVRMQRWVMDLADSQNADIIDSMPLVIGRNLNGRFQNTGLPGSFIVLDDTNQDVQPTRYSFGTTHSLVYYDPTGTT